MFCYFHMITAGKIKIFLISKETKSNQMYHWQMPRFFSPCGSVISRCFTCKAALKNSTSVCIKKQQQKAQSIFFLVDVRVSTYLPYIIVVGWVMWETKKNKNSNNKSCTYEHLWTHAHNLLLGDRCMPTQYNHTCFACLQDFLNMKSWENVQNIRA
jgi:hypothetical protein